MREREREHDFHILVRLLPELPSAKQRERKTDGSAGSVAALPGFLSEFARDTGVTLVMTNKSLPQKRLQTLLFCPKQPWPQNEMQSYD